MRFFTNFLDVSKEKKRVNISHRVKIGGQIKVGDTADFIILLPLYN